MFEFFEPEDEYKVDKGRHTNVQTRIFLLTALIILGSILVLAVNFDFINIFKEGKIKEACVYGNTYNRVDDDAMKIVKAKKALADHLETIEDLDGFLSVKIKFNKLIKDRKIPIISLTFEKKAADKNRIPKTICGFEALISTNND